MSDTDILPPDLTPKFAPFFGMVWQPRNTVISIGDSALT